LLADSPLKLFDGCEGVEEVGDGLPGCECEVITPPFDVVHEPGFGVFAIEDLLHFVLLIRVLSY
jgi:hypothetical protein